MLTHNDSFWMRIAIDIAKEGETPFGAVLADEEGQYVADYNTTKLHGATAHAEMNVIRKMDQLDFDSQEDLTLYTTVEPCPMCMGAIIWAGIGTVKYGLSIEEASKYGNQIMIKAEEVASKSWRNVTITGGLEKQKCKELWP
ncbi:MAG: nucleoside deaminase [Bacteroidota bacterium]